MSPWIKRFLEALDEEPRTLLITFFNGQGSMDWCFQRGFFYQLSGPPAEMWRSYFRQEDTNVMVRAVTWWDHDPIRDGTIDDFIRLVESDEDDRKPTQGIHAPPESDAEHPPPPPPPPTPGLANSVRPPTQKRITVPVDQLIGLRKKEHEDSSPTTTIPDAYLQRKAGSVPYLYVDPHSPDPYWIGRQEPCDTVINDLSISRKHCRIEARNGSLLLVDNGSANGSYVNEQRVDGETPVKPGDLVRVGRAMFILRHTPED